MNSEILGYSQEDLKNLSLDIISQSKALSIHSVEVDISVSSGKNLTVRNSETETVEFNNDKNITITFYKNSKKSVVSSSDFSAKTIKYLLENSSNMLDVTEKDPYFGLAEKSLYPQHEKKIDIHFPNQLEIDQIYDITNNAEQAARDFDKRIVNSEGASFNHSSSMFVYANSNGFVGGFPSTRYSLYCSVIGKKNNDLNRNYDYSNVRDFEDLKDPASLGRTAAQNTILRLNKNNIKTGNYPIILHHSVADALINPLLSAISGRNLYRQNSFMLETIGKKIASDNLTINEKPFLSKGHASTYFDDEGVAVSDNVLIDKGILNHYLLSSYSAKKLNLKTSGNAGGTHNLVVNNQGKSIEKLMREMNNGILITELLGHGINMVNGDFSRAAAGFIISNGEIDYAVEGITIAGNLKNMLLDIEEISNDINYNSSKYTGSILLKNMTVGSQQ
jgi:PmbA protein